MLYMHNLTAIILFEALNSFSAAENIACNTISRDEFKQVKNVMKMLREKVKTQENKMIDRQKEIVALKNGDKGMSKRTKTESRRLD